MKRVGGKIGLLFVMCATTVAQTTQPTERELTVVGAGGVKLSASLVLPARASADRKVPGVILVAGSGATDRDGNQGLVLRTDLLKQVAQALGAAGVASLRFDKRNVGIGRWQMPSDTEKLADYVSYDNFVGDVVAVFKKLQQQPEIDATRTGMIGHSEGGLLVLQAAADLPADERPRALVLLSTGGRTIDVILQEQLTRAKLAKEILDRNWQIMQTIRQTGRVPSDVPAELAGFYPAYAKRFWQEELRADPAKLAAQFDGPVLVVNGEKDIQVSAERDVPVLDAALKTRARDDHEVLIIPSASHNLKPVTSDTDSGIAGDVPEDAMQKIVSWVVTKLKRN